MGSEFDVEKSLEKVAYREKLIIDEYGDGDRSTVRDDDALQALHITNLIKEALEAGRVPSKPEIVMPPTKPCGCLEGHKCAADDTIMISREVAERWLDEVTDVYGQGARVDQEMIEQVCKALGSDE